MGKETPVALRAPRYVVIHRDEANGRWEVWGTSNNAEIDTMWGRRNIVGTFNCGQDAEAFAALKNAEPWAFYESEGSNTLTHDR